MRTLMPTSGRRRLLPLLALPLLVTAVIGLTGRSPGTSGDTPAAGGATAVTIQGFAFDPPSLEVAAGATVTWTNTDGAAHSIKDADGGFEESPKLSSGDTFEHTYDTPGTFAYFCGIHQYMSGMIVVS